MARERGRAVARTQDGQAFLVVGNWHSARVVKLSGDKPRTSDEALMSAVLGRTFTLKEWKETP